MYFLKVIDSGITRLTTHDLGYNSYNPLLPSCTITGWPSDFRALEPAALGHENHSANQLSHSGISGLYELSPRSKVVNPQLTPKKRDIGGITTVIHPIFGWITVVIHPNSSAISGLSTPISVHAAYAKKGFWFHVNNES